MKIVNAKYSLSIEFVENQTQILVIENQHVFVDVVSGLYEQCEGKEGDFVLSDNNKEIRFDKKAALLLDPFSLDFNDRKILNKFYTELEKSGHNYQAEKEEINTGIVRLLDNIVQESRYDGITFNLELDWNNLFKLYSVRLEEEYDSLLEKMIDYIRILANICNVEILCLVNITGYFNDFELQQLYKMAHYNKVYLLLIETHEKTGIKGEKCVIIDSDLCLIEKDCLS